jgi:hypothetical protein
VKLTATWMQRTLAGVLACAAAAGTAGTAGSARRSRSAAQPGVMPAGCPRRVILRPGRKALAALRLTEVGNFPRVAGHRGRLRVCLPGQTVSKVIPFPFGACSRGSVS